MRNLGMLASVVAIVFLFWLAQAYLGSDELGGQRRVGSAPSTAASGTIAPPDGRQPTAMAAATASAASAAPEATTASAPAGPADTPSKGLLQPVPVAEAAELVRPAVAFIAVRQVGLGVFQQPIPQSGVGSGVIFDEAGHLITNNHVIEGAREIKVTLPDGRTIGGKLLGADRATDLALVQIDGRNLPRARLGDSEKLRVGEWVVAIGNALGLEGGPTVTAGVVGALNRSITESNGETLDNLIQTDAAINPGNSGGPLINLNGEVVGINTAIASEAQGIGFAISISGARRIVDQLLAYGKVVRPYLGIRSQDVTPALASRYELAVKEGLLVVAVDRGTPAARAGIQQGDVLTAFDGEPLRNVRDLRAQLDKRKPGDVVQLTGVRGGKQFSASVTLIEAPR